MSFDLKIMKRKCLQLLLEPYGQRRSAWKRPRIKSNPKDSDIISSMRRIFKTYKCVCAAGKTYDGCYASINFSGTLYHRDDMLRGQCRGRNPLVQQFPRFHGYHEVSLSSTNDTFESFRTVIGSIEKAEEFVIAVDEANNIEVLDDEENVQEETECNPKEQ